MFPDRFGQSLFMESKLSNNKRDKLKDSEFGIPDKRAYPLNDKSHVEAAVRMFPHADDSDKKELAKRIISKAREFNMDTSGWDSLNEYIQESVAHGALLKVNDFKYDKVYFGSPNKISSPMKLDRPLFVSPFPGIASIFAVRPQNLSELGISVPNGKRVNKGYDEWNPKYKDTILRQPLKEVHIRLEGLPDFKPVTMMRQGYVYEIDVSNLKDNIYRNSWMSPVFEFLIANIDSVEFSNMTEVNIKTHIYGSELPKRFSESFSFDEPIQEAMVDVAFNNLRCKIADALGDKYKVSNIIHNSLNSTKDKFTVALSSNTSKFVNVVNDTTGVSVLGYLRNISMSHAFDRLMEFFTSPEFINESYLTYERLAEYDDIPTYDTLFQKCKDICDELSYFEYKIKGYEPTSQTINDIWKLQTPEETHKLKSGICYDYTEYVVNELQKIKDLKFKYRSIFIDMIWLVGKNYQRTTHAFVCCECDDKYIYIDTPQPNGNPPTVFNKLSDLILHVVNNMLYDESIQMSKLSRCMVFDFTDVCIPYRCDWKKYIDLIYDEGIKIDNLIDKKNKMIKEEYYMSDFVRDPSILRLFQEAKDSDEDEKEEEIDENLDESSEDIVDDDSEEQTTFGSDTSDVQNEYNPKDVETLNNLIAAENDAMNDYFEAGKNTNDDLLTRLYADIGAEERFHAEQLLYAKSVLTGEKYEPRDPEVKKEYEELLEMGMDEETAMTTAVDRLNIMNGSDDDIDMEDIEDALSITEAMLCMNSEQLETMLMICESDKYDIDEFCDDIQTFTESYYIEGAVNVADNKQVKEFKAKQDPLFFIARAFKNLFKFVIQIVKSIKQSMRALTVKRRNIADFIQKNGIKGLFAKGVSLYFFDIKNPDSIDEAPLQYCDLLYRLTTAIAKEVNYNMEPINSGNIQRIQFKNIEQGLNIIKGITLTKTKIIVNDENEDQIAKIFFGYTKEKAGVVKEKENSFEVQHKSMNIYTEYEIISSCLEACFKNSTKFVEYMEKLDSDVNSVKYKDKNKYNQVLESMKVVNKGYDIFLKALTHDMKVVMNMFNQMANETQAKDLEDNKLTEGSTTQQSS